MVVNVKVMSKKREKCKMRFVKRRIKMHNKMSATKVLAYLIYILEMNLSELISAENKNEFIMGSWEACIECIEIIGFWKRAKDFGLNYNPEIKYNIFNCEAAKCFGSSTKTPRIQK